MIFSPDIWGVCIFLGYLGLERSDISSDNKKKKSQEGSAEAH